jgi:DNA mismatch endonuclease Vsr
MPPQPKPRQARPTFDDVSPARRKNMAAIRGKNTKPELAIRRLLHAMGYRYRLHVADLPGRPDLVFPSCRAVVEIRGCFYHVHGCSNSVMPKTRTEWWSAKLAGNVERDRRNLAALEEAGWRVIVVWECEVRRDAATAAARVASLIGPKGLPG